jgi:hypothetical protein
MRRVGNDTVSARAWRQSAAAALLSCALVGACSEGARAPLAPTPTFEAAPSTTLTPLLTSGARSTSVMPWSCGALTGTTPGEGCVTDFSPRLRAASVATASTGAAALTLRSTVAGSQVTLTWLAFGVEAGATYVIEAGSASGLSDLARFDTGSVATMLAVTGVPEGTYYVRVRALASTGISAPSNDVTVSVGAARAGFVIELPIRESDAVANAYGLLPFGVHIGDHGVDGHPGWDLEFAPGATVYAAAAGMVQSVMPSGSGTGYGIQLQHAVGGKVYRTIYGVATLAPGVTPGASITVGQALGATEIYTRTIGRTTVTYSMTHFQVDDFSSRFGLTNEHAVPPERFLSTPARAVADRIWRRAVYSQELVEPFLDNSRATQFPMTRVWTRTTGLLAARLEISAGSASPSSYAYTLRDAAGAAIETGSVEIDAVARPVATIDLRSGSGSVRRGLYSIVDFDMTLAYGEPGAARPADLAGASTYRTQ